MKTTLRLEMELVPETAFNMNLRHTLKKSEWDEIRKEVYKRAGSKCEICGDTGRMSAHEVWDYREDEKKPEVVLQNIVCLCNSCHMCKHWGMAQILADEGKLDMEALILHFLTVNGCTKDEMLDHLSACFAQWENRSKIGWTLNISALDQWLSI